jgi:hypothetical protein
VWEVVVDEEPSPFLIGASEQDELVEFRIELRARDLPVYELLRHEVI